MRRPTKPGTIYERALMYLKETHIRADDGIVDFYKNGFCQKFYWQTLHITSCFTNSIHRKIKSDSFCKVYMYFCPRLPVNGKYERDSDGQKIYCDKYFLYGLGGLAINVFFDFHRYNLLKNDLDKSKMIADVFENELLAAFNKYGVGLEGTTAAKDVFSEIRKNNYVYSGTCKQFLLSPDRTRKVIFHADWKLNGIEIYVHVRKPRAKRDLCVAYLTIIRSDLNTINAFIRSVVWTSNDEFVATMNDLSGRKKVFNISECSVKDYEGNDLKTSWQF